MPLPALLVRIPTESPDAPLPLWKMNRTTAVCLPPASALPGRSYVQISLNNVDYEGKMPYEFVVDPTPVSIFPSGGPIAGGTVITIMGHGFRSMEQEDSYLVQWASGCTSRTQYSEMAGAARQATGMPDAYACGDDVRDSNSWMPSIGTDVPDWLQLSFRRPVRPWRWRVYMSARPESVVDVELIDTLGRRLRGEHESHDV